MICPVFILRLGGAAMEMRFEEAYGD